MAAHVTTFGTEAPGGFIHTCDLCQMNRIVPAQRFKHICPKATEGEPCPTCPDKSPSSEPRLPSLLTQATNLAKAAGRVAVAAATGEPVLRPAEQQSACLAICAACPSHRPSDDRCAECGCSVAQKVKFQTEICPLAKW